jgi:hypothetical protein
VEFASLDALARHSEVVGGRLRIATEVGLRLAAAELLHEVKTVPGTYQPAAGPYPAWAPLAEATKADRGRRGYAEDEPELVTQFLRDSYRMEQSGLQAGVGSDDEVALAQEVGNPAKNMPARPILGMAFVRAEKFMFFKFLLPLQAIFK